MPQPAKLPTIEERTYSFALAIVRAYRAHPPRDDADRIIWRQLLKSGSSAGANSAEGPGAQTRRDWITRRYIALKEMRESQFWLRLLRD
jgi:four helix bundle protein